MRNVWWKAAMASLALGLAAPALAGDVSFKDPTGDDNGPGTYTYPTDTVYKKGSFDLTGLDVKAKGDKVEFSVGTNVALDDPWRMGGGFSVQMVFIFIDTDNTEGSGNTDGLPGLNIAFSPKNAWEKVVIISPQQASRVKSEVETKAGATKDSIVVPARTKASGRNLVATVDLKDLGTGDPSQWGYQVVMQSNEGFPASTDLLTRKVNEYEGQHRFGGGNDGDCDPNAVDVLAGDAKGDPGEVELQHAMLKFECAPDGTAKQKATLTMVHAH